MGISLNDNLFLVGMYLGFQVLSKTLDVKLAPEKGEIVMSIQVFVV